MAGLRPEAGLRLISSMATRQVLGELLAAYEPSGGAIRLESVGGVDAANRVRAGEPFDVVVLAADAIATLTGEGWLDGPSRIDLARSGVAVAVRDGTPRPAIATEADLRSAVLGAATIGYSTGPSGVQLMRLFERWGIKDAIAGRLAQAPAGVPVGSLVADGRVALGFQQLSELLHLPGIEIVGPLPEPVQITTIFSAARTGATSRAPAAERLLAFLASPAAAAAKRAHGMEPA